MRAWLVLVLALLPSLAGAVAGDKRAAAQHFRSGSSLYEQGRYVEALEEFDAGYSNYALPGFQVNIGQCYRKLDRLDDAAAAFGKFLDSGTGDHKLREEVEEALDEVKAELTRRADAQASRRREEEQSRRALLASIDTSHVTTAAAPAPSEPAESVDPLPPGAVVPAAAMAPLPELRASTPSSAKSRRSRWWVWTIVGVAAAGAITAGVTVGVIESQPAQPRAGSLGLLDGRR
jgi:tetratricopeptide (TPR) repeat protein